ncbi:MAG: MFS transporter [Paracoccaceae bacterium]|jgi:MFS family permease
MSLLVRAEQNRNIRLYPWFVFCRSLFFWQAVWFLFFQSKLTPAEAILLYAVYDISTMIFEVPSGYMSDRLGRKITLILSAGLGAFCCFFFIFGTDFLAFALGNLMLGASMALASGTDSALLFETLKAAGRENEIEDQEIRAWRFSFSAAAISALGGGLMAYGDYLSVFYATMLAQAFALIVVFFIKPPAPAVSAGSNNKRSSTKLRFFDTVTIGFRHPALRWFLGFGTLAYMFSHVGFVFGQPFIFEALGSDQTQSFAVIVSGSVSAAMMGVSLLASAVSKRLRQRLGLAGILLFAFGIQISINGVLAIENSIYLSAILLLRMVPDAFSRPYILAAVQPLLANDNRATYLSMQSFLGRVIFAVTLYGAATYSGGVSPLPYDILQVILTTYFMAGLASFALFWSTARCLRV